MSEIKLTADSGGGTTSLKAPSTTTSNADVVLKLPVADGGANEVLKTDGNGQLSFTSNAGTTINNNADNRVITGSGTANTLEAESVLTFDSSTHTLQVHQTDTGNNPAFKSIHRGGSGSNINAHFTNYSGTNHTVILHDGSIGIGTQSPSAKLDIGGLTNTGGENVDALKITRTDGLQLFGINWNVSANEVSFSGNTKNYVFKNKSSSAESIRFPATGGITFNGDTATANALDDYEEGTWTPTIPSSGFTLTVYVATYIKIGRMVHVETGLLFPSNSDSSALMLGGLPFTAQSSGDNSGGLHVTSTNSGRNDHFFAIRGQTNIGVATNQNLNVARSAYSNKQIKFSGTYMAAS